MTTNTVLPIRSVELRLSPQRRGALYAVERAVRDRLRKNPEATDVTVSMMPQRGILTVRGRGISKEIVQRVYNPLGQRYGLPAQYAFVD